MASKPGPRPPRAPGGPFPGLDRYSSVAVALTLVVGILLSALAFVFVRGVEQARVRADFERRSGTLAVALQRSLDGGEHAIRLVAALFDASQEVERGEFATFARSALGTGSGLRGLAWIPRVDDAQRTPFERAAQGDGLAGYQIWEQAASELVRAGRREEYFPVFYLEHVDGNQAALGFDLASDADVGSVSVR